MRSLFVLLALSACVARAVNPLTGCSAGSAVQNTQLLSTPAVCGYGLSTENTGSWTTDNIASVSEAFFMNGERCGECFEVVGPLGSVIVTVTSYCPATSDTRCATSEAHFILSSAAFTAIANTTTVSVISDLGYRQVSCPVSGDISVNFPNVDSKGYYFNILPFNARIAVASAEVKPSGSSKYQIANRVSNAASFSWNTNGAPLAFPFQLRLTAETGQRIVTTISSLTANSIISLGTQFQDVPSTTEDCRMGVASPVVYNAGFGVGLEWDDSYWFGLLTAPDVSSSDQSLHAAMGEFGAVQFTRTGGFSTAYWSELTFTARASYNGYNKLRVYLGTDVANAVSIPAMTTDFVTYNVSIATLAGSAAVEPSIVIQNNDGNTVDVYFSYVALVRNDVPADAAPISTTGLVTYTTTANPPVVVVGLDTTSGNAGDGDGTGSEEEGSSSFASTTSVSLATLALLLVAALF